MLEKEEVVELKQLSKNTPANLAALFNALGDPNRLRIVNMLTTKKDICVSEFAEILKISIPAASQQLKLLEESGIVEKERMGQKTCYKIKKKKKHVKKIVNMLKKEAK